MLAISFWTKLSILVGLSLCRISDQGGGIPASDVSKVWHYGFTTIHHDSNFHGLRDSDPSWALPPESGAQYRMGGLGFGLPMSRLYAEYFGRRSRIIVCALEPGRCRDVNHVRACVLCILLMHEVQLILVVANMSPTSIYPT